MIVCNCFPTNEKVIKECIKDGCTSVAEISEQTGAGGGCMSCHRQIKKIIKKEKSKEDNT